MKLTRRQEEFIQNLHELAKELDGPIHYSVLAERLGVSPFTAYDMLCLLEEKGLVTSEYQLASDKVGPGRAERVFYPNVEAQARRHHFVNEAGDRAFNKEGLSEFVLDRIRRGEFPDQELAEEVLARIPPEDQGEELRYCMEVMTVIALRLRQSGGRPILVQYWPQIIPDGTAVRQTSLCLLAGFAFGILARESSSDPEWVGTLFEHVNRYLEIVAGMNLDDRDRLGNYLSDLFAQLTDEASRA